VARAGEAEGLRRQVGVDVTDSDRNGPAAPAGEPATAAVTRGRELRRLLDSGDLVVMPTAYDALSARIVEMAGFHTVFASGQAITNAVLGLPDYGYLGLTDLTLVCRRMNGASALPVFVDADTGFGTAVHVMHAVRELYAAGAAGLFIEDQSAPPRAGHVAGKELVSTAEMCGKIQAAVDARPDPSFVIGARTDARGVEGVQSAIDRANAYADSGADLTFVEGPLSIREMERFGSEVRSRYRLVNMGGAASHRTTPRPPLPQVQAMGYHVALFGANCIRSAVLGLWQYLEALREGGSQADLDFIERSKGTPFDNWYEATGFAEIRTLEAKYLPPGLVQSRYLQSQEGYYVPGGALAEEVGVHE
jgi:2,3-dimethylmalate lyase